MIVYILRIEHRSYGEFEGVEIEVWDSFDKLINSLSREFVRTPDGWFSTQVVQDSKSRHTAQLVINIIYLNQPSVE